MEFALISNEVLCMCRRLIHRSAWKVFSEVELRLYGVLGSRERAVMLANGSPVPLCSRASGTRSWSV